MIFIANVIGMSLSTAILIIIGSHIESELSFDAFQKNRDRIVRVDHSFGAVTPPAYGPYLCEESAEVESFLRILKMDAAYGVLNDEGQYNMFKTATLFADSTWHRFFELDIIYGNEATCLNTPNSVVLTASMAKNMFGDRNPLGEIISSEGIDLQVAAVVEDYPHESVFEFDVLVNVKTLEQLWRWDDMFESFGSSNFQTFLLLNKASNVQQLEPTLDKLLLSRLSSRYPENDYSDYESLKLIPFNDIYFYISEHNSLKTASKQKIIIYALLALFILLVSIINYVNIATVRSFEFTKSMALKKSFGAKRFTLGLEIVSEAIIIVFVSVLAGFMGAKSLMPYFSDVIDKPLTLDFSVWVYVLILIGVPVAIGILSGLYPAIMLSRIDAIPQKDKSSKSALRVRQSLSLLQFTGTLIVLIAISVIYLQNSYMLNYDTGLKKDNVLKVAGNNQAFGKFEVLKNKLANIKGVESVCVAKNNPVSIGEFTTRMIKGEDEEILFKVLHCSPEAFETFGIKLQQGRCFKSEENEGVCLINEAAARRIKNNEPLESYIESHVNIEVLGVVEDFNFTSLHEEIMPLVVFPVQHWGDYYVKLNGYNTKETIAQVGLIYNELFPKNLFDYAFVDETYHNMYKQELEFQNLMPILGLFAIIISCLGLFMLTVYAAQKRTKEVAIRKVNGARVSVLMFDFNRNIFQLVMVAFVIASPIAYVLMKVWLSSFKYQIALSGWIFISAALLILLIALLTVSWQCWRAANRNPVESLRYE